jgi:hypothetical protein
MVFAKGWPWTTILLPVPPIGITEMSHNTYFVCWNESCKLCLGWSQTAILPISASQVDGITGVSHHGWPLLVHLFSVFEIVSPHRVQAGLGLWSPCLCLTSVGVEANLSCNIQYFYLPFFLLSPSPLFSAGCLIAVSFFFKFLIRSRQITSLTRSLFSSSFSFLPSIYFSFFFHFYTCLYSLTIH